MSKKIVILSDSHGNNHLLQDVFSREEYDYAVFAGDYDTDKSYMDDYFNYYVDGNNDFGDKEIITFEIEGVKFLLTHSHQCFSFDKNKYFSRLANLGKKYCVDVVIYGHTHFHHIEKYEDIILVNPGSIALPRNPEHKGSYVIAKVDKGDIKFEIKYI